MDFHVGDFHSDGCARNREIERRSKRVINASSRLINQAMTTTRTPYVVLSSRTWMLWCRTTFARTAIVVVCFLIATANGSGLVGEHVCQQDERYITNITEYFPRNITIRSFKWCMQVPPRCSTFSYRIINDSRILEKEVIRQVNVCCDGFEPDIDGNKCISSCQSRCEHGECDGESKCYCHAGFRGDYCETACDSNRWGRYCRYHCECHRGSCDAQNGACQCPPGYTGLKCERPCPSGTFGLNCENICECRADQICDSQDGRCTNKVKLAVLKKYHTFDTNTNISSALPKPHLGKKIDMYLLTTEPSPIRTTSLTPTEQTNVNINNEYNSLGNLGIGANNEKLITTTISGVTTKQMKKMLWPGVVGVVGNYTDKISTSEISAEINNPRHQTAGSAEVNIKSMDRKVMKSEIFTKETKGKAFAEVAAEATGILDTFTNSSERVDDHNGDNAEENEHDHGNETKNNPQVYNFATISFLCIVVVAASGFFIATRLLKREEKEKLRTLQRIANNNKHVNNNRTSIFHTPLPDPPQSPFFDSTPPSYQNNTSTYHQRIGDNDVAINPRATRTSQLLEYIDEISTHTELQNLSESTTELSDVFYDQLPSTRGTYKATMAPEPPPMPPPLPFTTMTPNWIVQSDNKANTPMAGNSENSNCVNALPGLQEDAPENGENLYDEIPCWTRSTDNDALYINTRIENKTQF